MNVRSGTASVCPGFDPHRMEQPVVDHLIEQVRLDVGFDDSLEVAAGVSGSDWPAANRPLYADRKPVVAISSTIPISWAR